MTRIERVRLPAVERCALVPPGAGRRCQAPASGRPRGSAIGEADDGSAREVGRTPRERKHAGDIGHLWLSGLRKGADKCAASSSLQGHGEGQAIHRPHHFSREER